MYYPEDFEADNEESGKASDEDASLDPLRVWLHPDWDDPDQDLMKVIAEIHED